MCATDSFPPALPPRPLRQTASWENGSSESTPGGVAGSRGRIQSVDWSPQPYGTPAEDGWSSEYSSDDDTYPDNGVQVGGGDTGGPAVVRCLGSVSAEV